LKGCRPGKHPWGKAAPHGEKDATTDETTIRQWFKMPAVNLGVSIDGFVVLDFDQKHGGMETLAEWERKHGALPMTPTVKSGGGGRHFWFRHPRISLIAKPGRGVDCLWGNGGGLIMPPSLHESGRRYEWLVPLEKPLAEMPPWLVEIVAEKQVQQARPSGYAFDPMDSSVDAVPTFADLGMLPGGCRNDPVNGIIGSMLQAGYTPEQILEDGLRWAERQEPPYSAEDVRAKVRDFSAKRKVELEDLQYPKNAPLHRGEASSSFAVSPVRSLPSTVPDVKATPTPIEPIGGEHYYGLLGDFVLAVEPFTEADPNGILACLLAGVGNALGRSIHHRIGRRHGTNLFILLTGATTDRKGTCWDVAESLLSLAVPDWASGCIESGFGSGQGLVYRIRDAQGEDGGVPDKRLLVVEEEWAKPMRLLRSENSILSAMLREAFDGKPLAVMNKGENRYGCREPHVSVIGMITPEELLEVLKGRSEMHNGFLNRFLLVGVERTRYLPCGADYLKVCREYADRLREAVERAAMREPLCVAEEAAGFWGVEYRRLEQGRPGNYGKATARLSVHALKVAMLYAVLDDDKAIRVPHLRAALSLIAHADRTAFELFGRTATVALGEEPPHARLLGLARSRPDGINKTDAFRLFSNKRKAAEIDADFALLTENGFGRWKGARWFAAEESDMGGGVVQGIKAVCETKNGESPNATEAPGAKEGL
jgi:hypothetical protein